MSHRTCYYVVLITIAASSSCCAGIIGQWDFETTAFLDSSGFGHHLSLPVGSVSLTSGVVGNAAVFDGSGFLYNASPTLTTSQTQFSTGAWIRSNQTQGSDSLILGNFFRDSAPIYSDFAAGITLHYTNLYGYVYSGGSNANTRSLPGFTINDNQWHHVAQTFDGSTIRLYVNGVEIASTATVNSFTGAVDEFSVGGRSVLSNTFVGAIDEAFFANHAMTAGEIQELASAGSASVPEPSGLLLVGAGSAGFFIRRRRQRGKKTTPTDDRTGSQV